MNPVAQFDLTNMCLWYDLTLMGHAPHAEAISQAAQLTLQGDVEALFELVEGLDPGDEQSAAILSASSIWHEQRHFLDALLTNHAASRVRSFFAIYANNWSVLQEAVSQRRPLVCPLDALSDPILRQVHSLDQPSVVTLGAAEQMRRLRNAIADDRTQVNSPWGRTEVGGEAQMEAIAWTMQITAAQKLFGADRGLAVDRLHGDLDLANQRYRWALLHAHLAGAVKVIPMKDNVFAAGTEALGPLLFASMAGQYIGQRIGGSGAQHPGSRYSFLLKKLAEDEVRLDELGFDACWVAINSAAESLWGRDIPQELFHDHEGDLQLHDQLLGLADLPQEIPTAFGSYVELRGRLIEELSQDPGAFLNQERYPLETLPRIRPLALLTSSIGQSGVLDDGMMQVFGYENGSNRWWWASTYEDSGTDATTIALSSRDEWLAIVNKHAPLAKLLLNGRNHRVVLPVELVHIEKGLEDIEVDLTFLPRFAYPPLCVNAADYWRISQRTAAACDLCGSQIRSPSGHVLSPWLFRTSAGAAKTAIEVFGGGDEGLAMFLRDWSIWLACSECLECLEGLVDPLAASMMASDVSVHA